MTKKSNLPPGSKFFNDVELEEFLRTGIFPDDQRRWDQIAREAVAEVKKTVQNIEAIGKWVDDKAKALINSPYVFQSAYMSAANDMVLAGLKSGDDAAVRRGFEKTMAGMEPDRDVLERKEAAGVARSLATSNKIEHLEMAMDVTEKGTMDADDSVVVEHVGTLGSVHKKSRMIEEASGADPETKRRARGLRVRMFETAQTVASGINEEKGIATAKSLAEITEDELQKGCGCDKESLTDIHKLAKQKRQFGSATWKEKQYWEKLEKETSPAALAELDNAPHVAGEAPARAPPAPAP